MSDSPIKSTAKFRPVLSADDITLIIRLAKKEGTKDSLRLVASLARYEWMIQNEAVTPAYVAKPKTELITALGFESPSNQQEKEKFLDDHVSDEVLYNLWMQEPSSLTVSQLERVRTYRYSNNKMTVDEEKLYEKEVMGLTM